MNCFSGTVTDFVGLPRSRARNGRQIALIAVVLLNLALSACNAPTSEAASQRGKSTTNYAVDVLVTPVPEKGLVTVRVSVDQPRSLLRQLSMSAPASRFSDFTGDGNLVVDGDKIQWQVPATGGSLEWQVDPVHQRSESGYDAYIDGSWALFRASDIFPPAATRTLKGAQGETTLRFSLPPGWSSITQYSGEDDRYRIDNPERRFDRPTGWILLGNIGTRTEVVSGTRFTIAAPVGQGVRRMDMLAILRWTGPELARLFDHFPDRVTIFSAADPMWRGGLSAPASLYIHADRPLISENGTSTLMHELTHVGLGLSAEKGADWIIEGFAEYYSLQLLLRSGTIAPRRFEKAIEGLEEWGARSSDLCGTRSSGASTAQATFIMSQLDNELKLASKESSSLDDVMRSLVKLDRNLKTADFVETVTKQLGRESRVLNSTASVNCDTKQNEDVAAGNG